jgi:alpha-aminoadipate carrier protein LysW
MAQCPDCSAELMLPEIPQVGNVCICENCGAEMEITSLEPVALRAIEEMK